MQNLRYAQSDNVDQGELKVLVTQRSNNQPIPNARISISYTGDPQSTIEEVESNSSGMTDNVTLATPPLEYSMEPSENQPFSQYTIQVRAEGYRPVSVTGAELFSGQLALQPIRMEQDEAVTNANNDIVIPFNTLFGDFPPKIAESEIKPIDETGEIVLSRVVIPEYVIVHDGPPSDSAARDYYIRYRDYIKNVASSEIYATWPDATKRANILAIMSFTLNRVYTEWYRNMGYSFTITTSTAFDQKFVYGRNIFQSISNIVDEIFQNYLSRPNVRQPILTQYCDGQRVTCSNWLSQWGSKYLGDQGYSTIDILRYYYGSNMYINTAEEISGVPGAAGADFALLPRDSDHHPGRHLRAGYQRSGGEVSSGVRAAGDGSRGLSDLVQNIRDLCGGDKNRGIGLGREGTVCGGTTEIDAKRDRPCNIFRHLHMLRVKLSLRSGERWIIIRNNFFGRSLKSRKCLFI